MKNFKDGGFRKGGKDFGGRSKFGGRQDFGSGHSHRNNDRGDRFSEKKEMFSATCSHCNQSCEVPFRPNGDKPVYCSACFGQKSSENSRESNGVGNHFDRGRNNDNRKERTDFTRPSVDRSQSDRELGEIKRQLITIEARLNRILDLINPPMPAVKATKAPAVTINDEVSAIKVAKVKKAVKKAVTKTVKAKKVVTKKPSKKVAKKVAKKSTK